MFLKVLKDRDLAKAIRQQAEFQFRHFYIVIGVDKIWAVSERSGLIYVFKRTVNDPFKDLDKVIALLDEPCPQ